MKMTSEQYLQSNPIVSSFVSLVNAKREAYYSSDAFVSTDYWNKQRDRLLVKVMVGSKFIKLISDGGVWGFIARNDGILHGVPYRRGDLFRPATWRAPAKHSRGNIIDGTAKWDVYGPVYL